MKKTNVILLCLTGFLLACSHGDDRNIPVVDFSKHNFESITLNMDSIANSWKQIELETDDACLVTPYDNIYPCDSFIFIYNSNRILQFDCSGRFIEEIAHAGEGPDDVNLVLNCLVNEKENLLYIVQAGKPNGIAVYDMKSNTFVKPIPVAAKRMLISLHIVNDSTLMCFPFMGEKKQAVYFQNLKGDIQGQSELHLENPSGPFINSPLNVFSFDDEWYYQRSFEDTVYNAASHIAVAVFRRGETALPSEVTKKGSAHNMILLNRLFHTSSEYFLSYKKYEVVPTEEDGAFEMQTVSQRYFVFDWTLKTTKEIKEIIFDPLQQYILNKDMPAFFSNISSLNPNKIVIMIPPEELGKDAEANPVLYVGNIGK
jgi:hypothetical protein